MNNTQNYFATLQVCECCVCGTPIGIISHLYNKLRENGKNFYCPNGHCQCFTKTENMRLREELEKTQAALRSQKCETLSVRSQLEQEEKNKLKLARKLKRVQKGVCPCCNRTFQNLQQHMATQHPEKTS